MNLVFNRSDITDTEYQYIGNYVRRIYIAEMIDPLDGTLRIEGLPDGKTLIELKTEIAAEISSTELPNAKSEKIRQIDKRTSELIAQGFVYDNNTFSLSITAQSNIADVVSACENGVIDPTLFFPQDWTTIEDEAYSVADLNALKAMSLAALTTKVGHLDSGRSLKTQVKNATTVTEVDNIVDSR